MLFKLFHICYWPFPGWKFNPITFDYYPSVGGVCGLVFEKQDCLILTQLRLLHSRYSIRIQRTSPITRQSFKHNWTWSKTISLIQPTLEWDDNNQSHFTIHINIYDIYVQETWFRVLSPLLFWSDEMNEK